MPCGTRKERPIVDELNRMRVLGVRVAAGLVAVCTVTAAYFSLPVAAGLLLGGAAGIAGFWMLAVRVGRLAQAGAASQQLFSLRGTLLRLGLYAVALGAAYAVDRERFHGLIAAVAGMLLMRPALLIVVFSGLRHGRSGE